MLDAVGDSRITHKRPIDDVFYLQRKIYLRVGLFNLATREVYTITYKFSVIFRGLYIYFTLNYKKDTRTLFGFTCLNRLSIVYKYYGVAPFKTPLLLYII